MYGNYSNSGPQVGRVRSRWSVSDSKTFAIPMRQIELFVPDVVREVTATDVDEASPGRWRAALHRPFSLFDEREMTVALRDEDDSTGVEAEVVFDVSSWRLGLVAGLTTSVVGWPFVEGWRWGSARGARADASTLIDALWRGLESRLSAQAYR